MIRYTTKRIVTAGMMVALGIILPFDTAHAFGIPGNVFLPMHIPVLLCGFLCGGFYGGVCGLILPVLNSLLTGMPVLFPTGVLMTFELGTYGFLSGILYGKKIMRTKKLYLYLILIVSMIAGRFVNGLAFYMLLLFNLDVGKLAVVGSLVKGLPGIAVQLVVIPPVVMAYFGSFRKENDIVKRATQLVISREKDCVVVRDNKIVSAENTRGIGHIVKLHDLGILDNAFVADVIVGKAAAMIFTLSGVKKCYGKVMSKSGYQWLTSHGVKAEYGTLTEIIQNRRGDGMCPMETAVADIYDDSEALVAIRSVLAELNK